MTMKKFAYNCKVIGIHSKRKDAINDISILGINPTTKRLIALILNPLRILRYALAIKNSICHFHDPELLMIALILKSLNKSVIYDVHDDYEASIKDRLHKWPILANIISRLWWFVEKWVSRFFDGIVVADRHLAQKFAFKDPVILGNFPRLDFTTPADTSSEKTFNIIYVGGVNEHRGVGKVIDALQLLPFEDIRFHIVGECRDQKLLARINSNNRICYFGRIAWTELHHFYTKAHMGVALYQPLASFLYYPGENSVKIIEYMAAGIPVLCSGFPGLRKFVDDAGYGFTVQPDEPQAIADKIRYLYENQNIRINIGRKGRQAFENEYNWEKHENKLIALYERILTERGDH